GGDRDLSRTPFVGRDREVGSLDASWERVELERRPHLITVLGPPGVGKSRLAAEFMERIASRGGRVVRGRCLPYRERSAYGAFASQVKELAGIFDSDDVDVATGKLRTLVERLVGTEEAEAVAGHLEPLTGDDAAQLALHLLGADTKAAEVAQAAEGNPLFIEQLAAVMSESGAQAETLPSTIRGLVSARLDALPAEERDVILDASIVGRIFWKGALERIARDPDCLGAVLGALERRDLVHRDAVSRIEGDVQWSFKHVLIRDVAYDLQPRARRREGHRHIAEFIEASTPEVGEAGAALARHWRGAGELEHAVTPFV